MSNLIKLTESDIHNIIKHTIKNILNESSSKLLYHFLSFYRFEELINTDSFTPSNTENGWHNGKNTISFSRTKSFREGWPVLMYSSFDGKGDEWCAIRLTIDGNLINQKPNFKIDGKQYNMSVKPFDWAYKEYNNGDAFTFADNHDGIFAHNGKEWMTQSDDYTDSYLPVNYGNKNNKDGFTNGISDKQGHPYSQAEDRLTTYANRIPNATQYIIKVDILLLPYNFSEYNLEDRISLLNIITNSKLNGKIHVYDKLRNLELNKNEISDINYLKRLLKQKTANNYKNPIPQNRYNIIKKDY
jgi:hypothetical protein